MIWNKSMECINKEELRALQGERLHKTVSRVYSNVPFYREKMQQAGVSPSDIRSADDLSLLPFTNKSDIRDNYPYGLMAAPMEDIVRIQGSSGTTGKLTIVGYTRSDIDVWAEVGRPQPELRRSGQKLYSAGILWLRPFYWRPGRALRSRAHRSHGRAYVGRKHRAPGDGS